MDGFFEWALAFLIVVSLPFAGQLVGYFGYRLLARRSDLIAHLVGAGIPPVAFFFHLRWLVEPEAFTRQESIIIFGGATALEFAFGLALQLALHNNHKLSVETTQGAI